MIEIDREIDGAEDFELGRPRAAPLKYSITWPQEGDAAGVVLVIAGFGADTSSDYARGLRRHIVETTGMGAVSVRYHAIEARPENGAAINLPDREYYYLAGAAALNGARVKKGAPARALLEQTAIVARGIAPPKVILEPTNGEYQNFGVVQALDHLMVIGDLLESAPAFDHSRIVVLGSSHGGYIGHLMAKIAPSTLAAVIDNSSYAQPPMSYLGIGDEPEVRVNLGPMIAEAWTKSGWTIDRREEPNFYDRDRDLMRDLRFLPHAQAARASTSDAGTQFLMVSSTVDLVSPPEVKRRQQQVLARAGFAADLQMVEEKDIDGQLFKKLVHGLDCSLKSLFDREIGKVRPRQTQPDAQLGSVISYDCVDRGYRFTHAAEAPYVTGETYELYPAADEKEDRLRGQAA